MTRRSLDSERPIMAPSVISSKRASQRYSTYSTSPSFSSNCTNTTNNSLPCGADLSLQNAGMQEIKDLTKGLDRLENKPLTQQRYQPTPQKSDTLSKLALGAKVERALGRRMTNQDAIYRPKSNEKTRTVVVGGMSAISEKLDGIKV